ncbi:Centromere/kinetochore Zw10-domain-containing protein [Geopyxis carbonaria]|nr:Centromere/kinetochore Zw10-domain-containing protein [Geopyxis carbonaria]
MSSEDIADTILRSATSGYYPDSESIASAELSVTHLPTILKTLQKAKNDVKEEVRLVSRQNATEVDSWITQARQLHADIEAAKSQADEILKLADDEKALAIALEDAESQERFLKAEIGFSESLTSVLGQLQLIGTTLTQVDVAISRGELDQAVSILGGADDALEKLEGFEEIIVVGLMKEKGKQLRELLVNRAEEAWGRMIRADVNNSLVEIKNTAEVSSVEMNVGVVVSTLEALDLLKSKVDHFHQQIDKLLIVPCMETKESSIPVLEVHGDTLKVSGRDGDLSAAKLFADLRMIIDFLGTNLPTPVMSCLQRILVPNLTNRLISVRLSSSVPPTLDDLPAFEELLRETKKFEEELHKTDWTHERELSDWVERAPKVWLAKRRESSLDNTRKTLAQGFGQTKSVERSETQHVNAEDGKGAMASGVAEVTGGEDIDWGAEWGDGDEDEDMQDADPPRKEEPKHEPKSEPKSETTQFIDDDDDDDGADGWGLDDDLGLDDEEPPKDENLQEKSQTELLPTPAAAPVEEEDDDMDWNAWGEEEEEEGSSTKQHSSKPPSKGSSHPSKKHVRASSIHSKGTQASGNVTLTETYTITSIPSSILSIISQVLSEADQLSNNPKYTNSPISSAASGIRSLPTLILSVYRALAAFYYTGDLKSNMYLYNDALYMSEKLLSVAPLTTEKDLMQIESFGKRAFSKEMEQQHTILLDYLDGAQGFAGCTDYPQSTECDEAITSCCARIREIYTSWSSVLSKSALFQSVGTLLGYVIAKFMNDILDLSDISEPESVKLAALCEKVATLETLFEARTGEHNVVTVYCPKWPKFRYLSEILQNSMMDIFASWESGKLQEWFETEEVVELLVALFADSDMRRKYIDDIRRTARPRGVEY